MKKLVQNYFKPTPHRWRKIGDSVLFLGTTITAYQIVNDPRWALASCILTWLGKTITDFATDDIVNKTDNESLPE